MKVSIIGTSNSVIKNGYTQALREKFEVHNLSSGRNPIFFHIKQLLNNAESLMSSDVIIIDHYVNDINFYCNHYQKKKRINNYFYHINNYYKLLSMLGVPVINVMFPIRFLKPGDNNHMRIKRISKRYGHNVVDLNETKIEKTHYKDAVHIKPQKSFIFGEHLSEYILNHYSKSKSQNMHHEPSERFRTLDSLKNSPYMVLSADKVKSQSDNVSLENFTNSLISLEYLDGASTGGGIKYALPKAFEDSELLSIGYINLAEKPHGISINDKHGKSHRYTLNGKLYYHESFDDPIEIKDLVHIKTHADTSVGQFSNLMGRRSMGPPALPANIVELLVHNPAITMEEQAASAKDIPAAMDMEALRQRWLISKPASKAFTLSTFSSLKSKVKNNRESADVLRETAYMFEEIGDLTTANAIMKQAALLKPNAPVIRKKLQEYRSLLGADAKTA
uniref:hypothetical protein n=1 Tax=Halomonas sp. TaxID=1486246 RepID=UPI0026097EDD|nr:hypothetical protein [Halomonas sp.]